VRFNAVSLAGVVVQVAALWLLMREHAGYLAASSAAVLVAVVHNFFWHWRWTWSDRTGRISLAAAFARFFLANGLVSVLSNLALMPLLVTAIRVSPIPANLIVIVAGGLLNFWLAGRVAFRPPAPVSSENADRHPAPHGA